MWTSKFWLVLGAAAFILLAGVLAGTFLKSPGSHEALQYFDRDFLNQAAAYQRTATFALVVKQLLTWGFLIVLAAVIGTSLSIRLPLSLLPVAGYIALIVFALSLLTFPLDYFRGFVLEHRFGLSQQAFGAWIADYAKSFSISFVLTVFALLGLYLLMIRFPGKWWPIAGAFILFFMVLSAYLYPLVVDPLFYNFRTLENEELRLGILQMADEAGIKVEEVLVADASRRTNRVNAYFAGLGRTKRIVVYDNLLNRFTPEETLAVIAHEMGHWKHFHIPKGMLLSAIGILLGLFILQKLLDGMGVGTGPQVLVLALLFFTLFSFVSLPFQNALSRSFERQADREALYLTGGDSSTFVTLEQNLARANLAEVDPHPFVKLVLYTHPPVLERIELALREAEKYGL